MNLGKEEAGSSRDVRAVIFDLDGTLYDMKPLFKPMLTALLFPHMLRLPRYMSARRTFMGHDFGNGESLLKKLASETARREGANDETEIRRWIDRQFYPAFCRVLPFFRKSRPGLDETLRKLKNAGTKLGLISDFARIPERLQALGIDSTLFEHLVSTESEGCLKPCTRPFEKLAQSWNIANETILVVGDRSDTDGEAATGLGMQFIRIGPRSIPDRHVLHWTECRHILEQISNR